jgi:hypothetical protein
MWMNEAFQYIQLKIKFCVFVNVAECVGGPGTG